VVLSWNLAGKRHRASLSSRIGRGLRDPLTNHHPRGIVPIMDPDRLILTIASDQAGIVTRGDAIAAGLSLRQIRGRVDRGIWDQVHPGVYRMAGHPVTDHALLVAAVAATAGAASHLSAGALHGLVEEHPSRPEVTVPASRGHHRVGIRLHRTDDLAPRDVGHIAGVRCTNATRTIIDLGARLSVDQLFVLTERAIHRRLVHPDRMVRRFLQLARPGRDGIATMRSVLVRLDPTLAAAESDLESLLLLVLARAGLPAPVRQHPVTVAGHRYRLDAAYPDARLAIECDGFTSHGTRAAFESDRERQNHLVNAGWRVLRFTWQQIVRQPDWVSSVVREALQHPTS
jgi:very-short-patch-repair endonuclease